MSLVGAGTPGALDFRDSGALVVDDESFSRTVVRQGLRGFGFGRVSVAENGRQALEVLLAAPRSFDVIVTDVRMPEMDGLELLKHIRCGAPGVARDTVIGILTSHTDKEIIGTAFNLDVDFFVGKPPTLLGLKSRLVKSLSTPRAVKRPDEYAVIATALDATAPPPAATSAVETPAGNGDGGVVRQSIHEVQSGAVLGEDVRTSTGTLILQRGYTLTAPLIERLRDLAEVDPKIKSIAVRLAPAG